MYSFELDCYERAIRNQDPERDILTINKYVHLGLWLAGRCDSIESTKKIYLRVALNLEEVICDTLLSKDWRSYAFVQLRKLKPLLFEILSEKQYLEFNHRLGVLADFFLDGFSNSRFPHRSSIKNGNPSNTVSRKDIGGK
ncbi:hypothetical protein [Glaciecola sp. 1036]|uniref:hypothetical protein n=1 Tax=Alteromonadaceae TaxID=72275 RepID=UPI003D033192